MGAIFVEDLAEVASGRPVVFSAHGAPRAAFAEARDRSLMTIDATCPLVLKVHNEVRRYLSNGRHVFLIGHAGHPEVIGTMGQAPAGSVTLIQTIADAEKVAPPPARALAYATQTTLSLDDCAGIVAVLKRRFPAIAGPRKTDICYATQNRQEAVKKIAPGADIVFVVGSMQSSNSLRLVEAAVQAGAQAAMLVENPASHDLSVADGAKIIGVTSGASAPEDTVETLLMRLAERFSIRIETVDHVREDVVFKQPLMMAG